MTSKRASRALERLGIKGDSLRPTSKMMSEVGGTAATTPSSMGVKPGIEGQQATTSSGPETPVNARPSEQETSNDRAGSIGTTNSSPTDPAYVPNGSKTGGLLRRPAEPVKAAPGSKINPVSIAGRSFFDFDTESEEEEEEPVIGRASSVRISKANVVEQSPNVRGKTGRVYGAMLEDDRSVSPFGTRISEASEELNCDVGITSQLQNHNGSVEASQRLGGIGTPQILMDKQIIDGTQSTSTNVDRSDKSKRGGLNMNPVTINDKPSIQRAISAPPLPQISPSSKKVKIRPSDLVVGHSMVNNQGFRETVVTTPYPIFNANEKQDGKEAEDNRNSTALPQRSGTIKSARFDNDRFPSPDRPEILFLDLGLARHPAATTTLEIQIVDKGGYDDEMLFRQIRAAYRNRLLGASRLPLILIRGVTHATVSSSVEHDFRTTEFMKHFENPRIGWRRKTWVIWLRQHSRQHSPIRGDHLSIIKRPLSSIIRTADKRLSMQSDNTSTFNFSFLPPLLIPRLPFFNKDTTVPSSASTYRSPPAFGSEGGTGTIKVELHHEFSFWMLAFLYFWVVFTSIAAVVLWTIFGVPGARPGEGNTETPAAILMNQITWNAGAQNRVLTGLVLGIMVALLGSMMEISLIAGAYVLL